MPQGIFFLHAQGYEVEVWAGAQPPTRDELLARTQGADALLCLLDDKIDADFLHQNPQLKVVSNYAVGYNNIDVAAATQLGIAVGNTPDVLTDATADLAFALLLAVARKVLDSHRTIGQNRWQGWEPMGHLGLDLRGKTLGIVGLGRIGQALAQRCHAAYDMDILYTAQSPKPEAEKRLKAKQVSFNELLRQSDVVSVHASYRPELAELFNKDAFEQMKPTAIFINTARGGFHNEQHLQEALQSGQLWGAGLDVTNPEPMRPDHPLLTMPNVVITPHIASATLETRSQMSYIAAQNIVFGLEKKPLVGFVNPGVWG